MKDTRKMRPLFCLDCGRKIDGYTQSADNKVVCQNNKKTCTNLKR